MIAGYLSHLVASKLSPVGRNHDSLRPVADPENFGGGGFEAQNLKNSDVFTKIESDFSAEIGNSNVFFAQIQVVSKKKKKEKVFTKIETDFSPNSSRLGRWGGDASRNGAELFEIEADFSAKIVAFRLVGGMHPPIPPPPKSATASGNDFFSLFVLIFNAVKSTVSLRQSNCKRAD